LWLNKGKETGNRIPSGIPERKTHTLQKEGRNSPAGVYLFFKKENSSDFYNFPFSLSLFSTASLPWSKSYVQVILSIIPKQDNEVKLLPWGRARKGRIGQLAQKREGD